MRIALKFILAFLIIYIIFFNFFPKDYTSQIVKFDKDIKKFIPAFGIQESDLIVSVKKSFRVGNKNFLYFGRGYRIHSDFPLKNFESNFKKLIDSWGLKLRKEKEKQWVRYDVILDKTVVYTLSLKFSKKPYMAIVIDDWGYTPNLIPFLQEITIPLNIAILPELNYSHTVNIVALNTGHEVLLHLSLQPVSGKHMEEKLENLTIKKEMTEQQVKDILNQFLNSLQEAKGVNNHMGSLISRDSSKLYQIFTVLKRKQLYYLDSKVISDSKACKIAKKLGIVCFQRDVFIDNKEDKDYIKNQIRKGIKIAQKKGYSIIIGHAKYYTLQTIKEMVPEIVEHTIPVKLSDLINIEKI